MTKIHWHTSVKNFDIYGINDQPKVEKRSELIDLNEHRNWKFNSNIWPPCISWMISHTLSTCEMGNHWVLTGWGYVWAISFLFHWFKGSKLSNGQLIIHICCFCQTGRLQKKRINILLIPGNYTCEDQKEFILLYHSSRHLRNYYP